MSRRCRVMVHLTGQTRRRRRAQGQRRRLRAGPDLTVAGRSKAGREVAGSVPAIGTSLQLRGEKRPVPPGGTQQVGLDSHLAGVLAEAYASYLRAAADWREHPGAHRRAALRLAMVLGAAHARHWPWGALARYCGGISAEAAPQLAGTGADGDRSPRWVPSFPDYREEVAKASPHEVRRAKVHLSEAELAELAELRDLAVSNAGGVPLGDPRRRASERFSALIASAHERGVTWRGSGGNGADHRGPRARVARHGLSGRPRDLQERPEPDGWAKVNGPLTAPGGGAGGPGHRVTLLSQSCVTTRLSPIAGGRQGPARQMTALRPTGEQQDILDAVATGGTVAVSACAGTGRPRPSA